MAKSHADSLNENSGDTHHARPACRSAIAHPIALTGRGGHQIDDRLFAGLKGYARVL